MKFMKWHGAGNDFILLNATDVPSAYEGFLSDLAIKVCHRHFGIGADGLMVAYPSSIADIKMVYYNSDGSHAAMCGNGIRCFSSFCHYSGLIDAVEFSVETDDGVKNVSLTLENGYEVSVHMGEPNFDLAAVPSTVKVNEEGMSELTAGDQNFQATVLKVGVPHTVVFLEDREFGNDEFVFYGRQIEHLSVFPERTNVNFVKKMGTNHLRVDTWERGAGLTLACGTGVCASAIAAYRQKMTDLPVKVTVAGGILSINLTAQGIVMTGPAVAITAGEFLL